MFHSCFNAKQKSIGEEENSSVAAAAAAAIPGSPKLWLHGIEQEQVDDAERVGVRCRTWCCSYPSME